MIAPPKPPRSFGEWWTSKVRMPRSNLVLSLGIAAFLTVIASTIDSSRLPPCDLLERGVTVETSGCTFESDASAPCMTVDTSSLDSCVLTNYHRLKTVPFAFTQPLGPGSNLLSFHPVILNAVATFVSSFLAVAAVSSLFKRGMRGKSSK